MPNLRAADERDLPAILEIYNHAIETTTAVFSYRPHTLEMRREWLKEKTAAHFPVLVAVEDDHVVGFATYGPFRVWPAYKYTVEHSVYVSERYRGRGIGRALVGEIVSAARHQDLHVIVAGIVSDNLASLRLHRGLGFVDAGCIRQVGYKFGRWLDLTFLQLVLETPHEPREP